MEIGRRLFPKRIPKSRYWNDLATRPYMRGLRNLTLALNRQGQFDKALGCCDRLEAECGDDLTANIFRASIHLNLGSWAPAAQSARYVSGIYPGDTFLAAFAHFELGQLDEAKAMYLRGLTQFPRAAQLLAGLKDSGKPRGRTEFLDRETALLHFQNSHAFFKAQSRRSKSYFLNLLTHPSVQELLGKVGRL